METLKITLSTVSRRVVQLAWCNNKVSRCGLETEKGKIKKLALNIGYGRFALN